MFDVHSFQNGEAEVVFSGSLRACKQHLKALGQADPKRLGIILCRSVEEFLSQRGKSSKLSGMKDNAFPAVQLADQR